MVARRLRWRTMLAAAACTFFVLSFVTRATYKYDYVYVYCKLLPSANYIFEFPG